MANRNDGPVKRPTPPKKKAEKYGGSNTKRLSRKAGAFDDIAVGKMTHKKPIYDANKANERINDFKKAEKLTERGLLTKKGDRKLAEYLINKPDKNDVLYKYEMKKYKGMSPEPMNYSGDYKKGGKLSKKSPSHKFCGGGKMKKK